MITHCGWSVQLYLANHKLTPFDVQIDSNLSFASYAVPSPSLSLGTEWYLIWRDDSSTQPQQVVVGTVNQFEGEQQSRSNELQESLVGTSISPQSIEGVYPSVKGIIRMGIAPLKLNLQLRRGHSNPLPLNDSKLELPIASFQLVIYPEQGTKEDINGPVNSLGSQTIQQQQDYSPLTPTVPSTEPLQPPSNEEEEDQLVSLSLALSSSRSQLSELSHSLSQERSKSTYFEQAVETLYNRFEPNQELEYSNHRLKNESLAPHIRVAVAVARDRAREKLGREEKEGRKKEIEGFLERLNQGVAGAGGNEDG
ncbi:hypothetical protein JCM5353_003233 [Sporobolomyces roseus]